MAIPTLNPLPPPATRWIDPTGQPALPFRSYFLLLDMVVRGVAGYFAAATFASISPLERGASRATPTPPILIEAADDAAAAAAGVPVGAFYRNGSQVMIRIA